MERIFCMRDLRRLPLPYHQAVERRRPMNRQQGIRNTQAMAQDRLGVMRLLFHGRSPPSSAHLRSMHKDFPVGPISVAPFLEIQPQLIDSIIDYRLSTP